MGNTLGGRKKTAKIMKIDGTTFRLKSPATAGDVLRDHPGYDLLNSEEVKQLGIRAQSLSPDQLLQPGKLYFLVELPRLPNGRAPRRAWSGALQVSARDRLENLKLTRRSVSDLSIAKSLLEETVVAEHAPSEGALRLRLKLPRAQVEKLMQESRNSTEAAEKIVELFTAPPPLPPAAMRTTRTARKEKRTRFVTMAEEVIALKQLAVLNTSIHIKGKEQGCSKP